MSLQNKKYKFGPSMPGGSALDWDMTKLSDDQLQQEYTVSHEALYGSYVDGKLALDGLVINERDGHYFGDKEQFYKALATWRLRLKRAEDELERRFLLS